MKIGLLADYPQFLNQVAAWCNGEWPEYYQGGKFDIAVAFQRTTLNHEKLPCTLIAYDQGRAMGTISLLEDDMDIRPNYTPWLASFFAPAFRSLYGGKSVGLELFSAGLMHARQLGLRELYAWTRHLGRHLRQNGWQLIENVRFQDRDVEVWKTDLSLVSLEPFKSADGSRRRRF
jgi:hypothetical protein